jgi:hypothetical protein
MLPAVAAQVGAHFQRLQSMCDRLGALPARAYDAGSDNAVGVVRGVTAVGIDAVKMANLRGREAFDQLLRLERQASRIVINQPASVPSVLQTAGYAAEIVRRVGGVADGSRELADRVDRRMRRAGALEERLRGPDAPRLLVVLDEGVLRRAVGGPDVMREQLEHLSSLAALDVVTLAVVRFDRGAHAGLGGSFEVHEMPGGRAAVFFEAAHGDRLVGADQALADRLRAQAEATAGMAATGDDARALLTVVGMSMGGQSVRQ